MDKANIIVGFHQLDDTRPLKYVVIPSRYENQWVFVNHKDRVTYEIPGGHIEAKEHPDQAAKRELQEETGALSYKLFPICDYSVSRDGIPTFGRLYFADIRKMGDLPDYEIEKVLLTKSIPKHLTYPMIQPFLYNKVMEYLENTK